MSLDDEERELATDTVVESAREKKIVSEKSILLESKWLP